MFALLVERLLAWRDQAIPLRVCGAPGRMFTIIEDYRTWLPLPRRSHPTWA